MESHAADGGFLFSALVLLFGAVFTVPIFKRLGLGSVLGYLAAGVMIGPVLKIITDGDEILHFAEFGVVLLLFVIGLELKPSRLWAMRRDIFGLGALQVVITGAVLAGLTSVFAGFATGSAIAIGFGLALSSTAFGLQILEERGEQQTDYGQRSFSILLFQDLAIVPLIALISVLAPGGEGMEALEPQDLAIMLSAVIVVVLVGRYLLNPFFRILARADAREIMTAAALFIVLGAAELMDLAGLSMAMGAFLAGVLLAESSFRHQLEADIEPFRGLLLGLFFMAVGLSLDLDVVLDNWLTILIATPVLLAVKAAIIYGLMRGFGSPHNDAIRSALLLPQAGEFGFVLFTLAASLFLISPNTASILTAVITLTMALTPLTVALGRILMTETPAEEMDEDFTGAEANVLMIGFSRFGHIAAQHLLAAGINVTIIDNDADRIRSASTFGFKIYYGDGQRLDVLRAAGAAKAQIIAICVHAPAAANRIVEIAKVEFPLAKLYVRSYDRVHTLELLKSGVDYEIRETYESAMAFGQETLEALGIASETAQEIADDVRRRDLERLAIQQVEGVFGGADRMFSHKMMPEPLIKPQREAQPLSEETAEVAETETGATDADDPADTPDRRASV